MYNKSNSPLIFIGENAPMISFIYALFFLVTISQTKDYGNILLYYYVVGSAVSIAVNRVLKVLIKQPRPGTPKSTNYGMPSGHVQAVAFTVSYLMFANQLVTQACSLFRPILYVLYVAMSAWQRVYCNRHTVEQVVAGCIMGVLMAYIVSHVVKIK